MFFFSSIRLDGNVLYDTADEDRWLYKRLSCVVDGFVVAVSGSTISSVCWMQCCGCTVVKKTHKDKNFKIKKDVVKGPKCVDMASRLLDIPQSLCPNYHLFPNLFLSPAEH